MSLPLPVLDDRTYADLVEEARASIPSLCREWTDHNPTDPGITLIELFAWLAEMLIYRLDRVTDGQRRVFLRLLNGPDWEPGPDLEQDLRATVTALRRRYRAVTAEDYERLAREASSEVARAWCVPRRNLAAADAEDRRNPAPGHVSLIVLPAPDAAGPPPAPPAPSEALLDEVWRALEPRRLLTTRHHVVGPSFTPVEGAVRVVRRPDAEPVDLRDRVLEALEGFFDPLTGGPLGGGWPLGRDVYLSELHQVLEGVAGVDYVSAITLDEPPPPAELLDHPSGEPIGLGLPDYHLPWARFTAARIEVIAGD